MVAAKEEAQEMIKNLPDNYTYEDIQYHLYVVEKIKNGISRAENGEVSSHQDAKQRMTKWLSHLSGLKRLLKILSLSPLT